MESHSTFGFTEKIGNLLSSLMRWKKEVFLKKENVALGFAVGREPLPSYFASKGVDVLATDLPPDSAHAGEWSFAGQHAADLSALYYPAILERQTFDRKVRFAAADMTNLDATGKRLL